LAIKRIVPLQLFSMFLWHSLCSSFSVHGWMVFAIFRVKINDVIETSLFNAFCHFVVKEQTPIGG
jgi:hypothetical protein